MKLDEILTKAGKYKNRKRIGRGDGSGQGCTSGRGHKGYGARSGNSWRIGYAGGQNPLLARIPKRGFNNANFRKSYQVVNLDVLQERFEDGQRVDAESLTAKQVISDAAKPIKILGNGELSKKLTVAVNKVSASAGEKIAKAGGSVEQA